MKKTKIMALLLSATLVFSGCGNMNNTAKGGLIGGGGGAALGAIIGGIAGHGKGAAIGAAVGAAVGTGAGVLIGKKMDKAAEEAAQIQGAPPLFFPYYFIINILTFQSDFKMTKK